MTLSTKEEYKDNFYKFAMKYASALKRLGTTQGRLMKYIYGIQRHEKYLMKALHSGDISHIEYYKIFKKYEKPIVLRIVPRGRVIY
jgi:hypothetical protein